MKRMRTSAASDSATSESDVENSCNTDNEVESDSDNVDDTSSKLGDEYESDPWAPLKAEAAQQSLSEFEELTQNFTAEAELYRLIGKSKKQSKWNKSGIKNIPIRQSKSSRKRTKSNTKPAKNVDITEMDDSSKEWLKLETKTE
ncbi:Hypothetical predicted protein [Paramuricea clavata]|uniref:Uncharacterized protein n=1 Tax=Paramuricea clavata TaxID=317549 RepID=A0A7D9EUC1_PARCT|nr:Hypothetical predicted protein [Paramuricea clavata]